MNDTTSWWDDFSNNLATDFAPLIALFGESPTKQFLSECLSFTDTVIFATAPIGVITALISAIRVRGSSSLRAFIGRAQEGGGNAEAELCSSTSRDVCELYNNGGIARVFGRPKLLEVVLDDQSQGHDFYNSDQAPPTAGIYSFKEYISKLRKRKTLQTEKNGKDQKDWEEQHSYQLRQIFCLERQSATDKEATPNIEFAPNPNLSLNIGIKKKPTWWFIIAAIVGVLLQSFVLIWAAVARYKLNFVRDGRTDKYAVPMTVIGTLFVVLGVGLCAFLVDSSTEERVFKRKKPQSHMYWVQPGNQYLGDQAFDSFAYSDRNQPLNTYTSSRKKRSDFSAMQKGRPKPVKRGEIEQDWLVWTTSIITTLGFIVQFVGLRACHSSVALAQLGAMLIMTIIRSGLRTQRMKQEDNCMSDRPDAYAGHELDWLALYMDLRDEPDSSNKAKKSKTNGSDDGENRDVLYWEIPSSASVLEFRPHTKPLSIPSPKDATPPENSKPDAPIDMAKGFKLEAESESLEWLKNMYSPGSNDADCPLPYESARRFLYRSRLARMTTSWDDNQIAVRSVARKLAKAITETANALTLKCTWNKEYEDVRVFLWPIQSRLLNMPYDLASTLDATTALTVEKGVSEVKTTQDLRHDPRQDPRHLIYLTLKRPHINGKFGAWTVDESELEAVVGLWAWTINEQIRHIQQISDAYSDKVAIFRILSTESGDPELKFWQAAGGTPIAETTLRGSPPGLLICGLHNSRAEVFLGCPVQALEVKHTTPNVCAQELYSLFLLSMLKAAVKDIGGKTEVQGGFGTFLLTNTTVADVRDAFIESGLGFSDDAFACTIPALISSDKLPSVRSTLTDTRKAAEQHIKKQEWQQAEELLKWTLEQCKNVNDSTFEFENHQRLLVLAMCECYRKSLLAQPPSNFGIRGFLDLIRNGLSQTEEIGLLAYDCPSNSADSLSKRDSLRNLDTLASTIRHYGNAALQLTAKTTHMEQDVRELRYILQNKKATLKTNLTTDHLDGKHTKGDRPSPLSETTTNVETTKTPRPEKALNDAIMQNNLTETLYLVSRIEMERHKIKLDNSLPKAAERGWYTVVRALTDLGENADSRDDKDRTAFTYAVFGRDFNVLQYLFEQGFYPNFTDTQYRSPLSHASEKGLRRIVERLLGDPRVSADSKDSQGHTPLWWAASNGHAAVVELLLKTGKVDVNVKDSIGGTPLLRASSSGHADVVQLLLNTDKVDVEIKDSDGWTPLRGAASNGHADVVELLLKTDKVDVDARDSNGQTPIWWAVFKGHVDVVELLLKTNKVDVNVKDSDGWTPLRGAASNGHTDVVELLLKTNKVDANVKDSKGGTPLMGAASSGHADVVELLLNMDKVDVDIKDSVGWTPLRGAASNGHADVVELLLKTDKVDANVMDSDGRTPLWLAASDGHADVVELLLKTDKVDANVMDSDGRTPLWLAASDGHADVVELLLKTNKVDVDAKDSYGSTPLRVAASSRYTDVVDLLLKTNKVDVNAKDSYGWTPLQQAASSGHTDVVELLLKTDEVNANVTDSDGRTPLWLAASDGHADVVELLLKTNKVDVDAKDRYGWTPLQQAASSGHADVVELLERYAAQ